MPAKEIIPEETEEAAIAEAVSTLMIDFEELAKASAHELWRKAYARGVADASAKYEKKIRDTLGMFNEAPPPEVTAPSIWKFPPRAKPRRWTDDELEKLHVTAAGDGDYEALGKEINRTALACEKQARNWHWYKNLGADRWPDDAAPAPVADVLAPPDDAPAPIENDDEDADLDDLTKATRDVLLAMSSVGDNVHVDQIAALAETPPDRIPGALQRLAELKLAHRPGGKWSLTEAGAAMALKVKEDEA